MQNKQADNTEDLRCDSCNKVFTTKHTFSVHLTNCKEKMLHTIETLTKTLDEMKEQVRRLTDRNTYLEKDNKTLSVECMKYRVNIRGKRIDRTKEKFSEKNSKLCYR